MKKRKNWLPVKIERTTKQQEKLDFLIREHDAYNVYELMEQAESDPNLHRQLRECGIRFPKRRERNG